MSEKSQYSSSPVHDVCVCVCVRHWQLWSTVPSSSLWLAESALCSSLAGTTTPLWVVTCARVSMCVHLFILMKTNRDCKSFCTPFISCRQVCGRYSPLITVEGSTAGCLLTWTKNFWKLVLSSQKFVRFNGPKQHLTYSHLLPVLLQMLFIMLEWGTILCQPQFHEIYQSIISICVYTGCVSNIFM